MTLKHRSELFYTTDDDGVWLTCTHCLTLTPPQHPDGWRRHWMVCLGFDATIDDAAAAWAKHVGGDEH